MITTEGFKLNNLARFTPADPTLVAFNPTKLSEGALQTLQLANNLQKYQVQKSQMEELEALKQARIKAGLAGLEYDATKKTEGLRSIVPGTDADIARYAGVIATEPGRTAATNATNQATVMTAVPAANTELQKLNDISEELKTRAATLASRRNREVSIAAGAERAAPLEALAMEDAAATNLQKIANESEKLSAQSGKAAEAQALETEKTKGQIEALRAAAQKDTSQAVNIDDATRRFNETLTLNKQKLSENINHHTVLTGAYKAAEQQLRDEGLKATIQDPADSRRLISLAALDAQNIVKNKDGNGYHIQTGIGRFNVDIPPSLYEQLQEYKQLKSKVSELGKAVTDSALSINRIKTKVDQDELNGSQNNSPKSAEKATNSQAQQAINWLNDPANKADQNKYNLVLQAARAKGYIK